MKKHQCFWESVRTRKEPSEIKADGSLFKGAISYNYQLGFSERVIIPTTKTNQKKVPNMVGTFFNKGATGFRTFRVTTTKKYPVAT
ncbi:hypothetical protein [Emticicia sp. BO119]|uniref:hypothetical protein n=1 Tax=Emticicia sp. BO119 TaxID=2757768 RepID=UPI0015F0A3B0|nr:hypothetical protein [Emticicia sp. BO119]MBA4851661.1 hypothetical protein [Emticicia sp. BO119]